MDNKKMTVCKHCGEEIAKTAKVCPKCGGKNKNNKGCLIAVIVVIALIGISAIGKSSNTSDTTSNTVSNQQVSENEVNNTDTQEVIEYTPYTVSQLESERNENALKAKNTHINQYVSLTGKLGTIDSDGKYISLMPTDDDWAIQGIMCYIKNEEQLNKVMNMTKEDIIVINGKITDVGEVLGYTLDIDSIE
jgi:RNA polymerase subunit RPABC4/transcription elongation factor Spt4